MLDFFSACRHIRRLLPVFFLIVVFSQNSASAQLSVDVAPVGGGTSVETDGYPLLSARIRAVRNGSPVTLTASDVYVIEGNYSTQPFKIDPVNGLYQRIYWYSRSLGVRVVSPQVPVPNAVQFIVLEGNEVATANARHALDDDIQVRFRDFLANTIYELAFTNVPPGTDSVESVNISAVRTRVDNNQRSEPVRIDSITNLTPYFKWRWRGTPIVPSSTPPTFIQSPFRYQIDVTFSPVEAKYYHDVLTIHYAGGAKETIQLTGNKFILPQNTILNITEPNVRQNFTPCQAVTVRWKGSVAGAPNIIEYSTNAGAKWLTAGQTMDSSFIWTVPSEYTDSLALRVRQDFTNFSENKLRDETAGGYALSYSRDGLKFVVGYENGVVAEYVSAQQTIIQKYNIGNVGFPIQKAVCFGVAYLSDGSKVVAGYRRADGTQELDFFAAGNTAPTSKKTINAPVNFRSLMIDPSGQTIICAPEFGNLLYLYSAADGSLLRTISFPAPLTAFTLNPDGNGAVALLDGTVALTSAPNFALTSAVKYPELPVINGIALSPNNELLGIATKASIETISSGNQSTVHIIDIATKTIIRTLRKTSSDALNLVFNGTSRYLGLGFAYQPQVALWQIVDDSFNGGLSGHTGQMTSITYSPDGRVIATTGLSIDNVVLRNFSYPETDQTDEFMRIVPARIAVNPPTLAPNYLMNKRDTLLRASVCNNGESLILFDRTRFSVGRHFELSKPITTLDTLFPGKCLEINLTFHPKDTGLVRDTLILTSCSREFFVPVEGYSANRNIAFLANGLEFGESCVGDSLVREIELLRNTDPVPLEIDQLSVENGFTSGFSFTPPIAKTRLLPGESLKATVRFYPKDVGADVTKILVLHSGQTVYIPSFTLRGTGIGADVTTVSDLRFLPEISTRTVVIKNNSPNPVVLRTTAVSPQTALTISPAPPITIPPNGSVSVDITANGALPENGLPLEAEFNPCIVKKVIVAGAYSGTSAVSVPVVEADPHGEATIPVYFKNTENKPYNGVRFFEGEITLNPRLFMPLRAESQYGSATIIRNDIVNGKRVIGFRVEGDFPLSGTAVNVIGPAGLAETDSTPIEFTTTAKYWGTAVQTQTSSGSLRIINTCDGCRLIHDKTLAIAAVIPNPATTSTNVTFYVSAAGNYEVGVLNGVGMQIGEAQIVAAVEGANIVTIPVNNLEIGAYRVAVKGVADIASAPLIIVR